MGEEEQLGSLLPLAYWMAHHYEKLYKQDFGDFETAALIGAWSAVKKWDPSKGTLKAYARYRIRGEIVDAHRKECVQKGGGRNEENRKYTYCVDFNDLGRDGDGILSEAAAIEGIVADRMEGRTGEKGFSAVEDHDVLMHLKARMEEREWDILARCVCNEETMKSVGEIYGVTESRICQLLPVALRHARKILEEEPEPFAVMDGEDHREAEWIAKLSLRPTGT